MKDLSYDDQHPSPSLDSRLRSMARRKGLGLSRSRDRSIHSNNYGGYMLFEVPTNTVVGGASFDLSPVDAEELIAAYAYS